MPKTPTRYRLIALDLDGTTLDPNGRVAPRTRNAIQALVRLGVYVCFSTGRNFTESKRVLAESGHYAKAVFVGGASVVDTAAGTSLVSRTMQPDLARELCGTFESSGHAVLALQDTFTTGIDYLLSEGLPLDAATQLWMKLTSASVQKHQDLAQHEHTNTLRVGICTSPEEAARVNQILETQYAGRVMTHSIKVQSQGVEVIEVFDPAVNKWEGVSYVASSLGITADEVIAVGDDLNDLAMLRQAGLGVAMGNAVPRAKDAAKLTIGPNTEDGLAQFLEQLIREDRIATA